MQPQLTLPRPLRAALKRAGLAATVCVVLAFGVSTSASAQAGAEKPTPRDPALSIAQRGERPSMTLQQAIDAALQRHKGRVVRAETISRNGRPVHEIRILADDGRVRTLRFDANAGQ